MSDPANPSRRRPPTIDLTAQEVETEAARPSDGAPGTAQKSTRRNFAGPTLSQAIAAGAGAVIAAAIIAVLWSAGIIPSRDSTVPPQPVRATPDVSAQLNKIESALQARPPAPDPVLTSKLAAIEAQTKTLSDSLAALNRRLDDIAVAAKSAGERADAASAAAKTAGEHADAAAVAAKSADAASAAAKQTAQSVQTTAQKSAVQRSDLDALSNRIAALDQKITALGNAATQQPTSTDDRAARTALAAQALRRAVERGAPYQAELGAVKALGTAQADTAPLEPFAASGVPSAADLGRALAQLTPSLQPAAATPTGKASLLSRLEDNAKNLVHVTPVDAPPPGDDPTSIITRLNIDAAHADISAALADIARLPQPLQTQAAPWVQKAKARDATLAAAHHIAANAIAGLGQSDSQ